MSTTNPRQLILAVDGGGSKTTCWVADATAHMDRPGFELEILGRGQAGPSNPRSIGFVDALANIELAIRKALDPLNSRPVTIAKACLSIAGAGRSDEQQRILEWANQIRLAQQTIIVDDIVPLRFAAEYEQRRSTSSKPTIYSFGWMRSITLVIGTGSIASGCDEHGTTARTGGWGYLLGDEGSGYAMGLAGLRSICNAHDQGSDLSEFQRSMLQHLKLDKPTQLVEWIYQNPIPRANIAELAEWVLGSAKSDPVADKITHESVMSMAQQIEIVAKRLGFGGGNYSLALSGGILHHHDWLRERLLTELSKRRLAPSQSHLVDHPILGALMFALPPEVRTKLLDAKR